MADAPGGYIYTGFSATTVSGTGGGATQLQQTNAASWLCSTRTCGLTCGDADGTTEKCITANGCCGDGDCDAVPNGVPKCVNNSCNVEPLYERGIYQAMQRTMHISVELLY